jgi:hypothetical protein
VRFAAKLGPRSNQDARTDQEMAALLDNVPASRIR